MDIAREARQRLSAALTTDLASTAELDFANCVAGEIHFPAVTSATLLTWYAAPIRGGTYIPAYDSAATPVAVTQTVAAARAYPVPIALAGCAFLKCVANAAVTVDIVGKT